MKLSNHDIKVSFTRLNRAANAGDAPMAFMAIVQTPAGTFSSEWNVGVGHAKYLNVFGREEKNVGRQRSMYAEECRNRGIAKYKPVPEDLICHILVFSDVLETTFPEWAENLGESADSISAKAGYETYHQQNIILRNAFGDKWQAMVEYAHEQ